MTGLLENIAVVIEQKPPESVHISIVAVFILQLSSISLRSETLQPELFWNGDFSMNEKSQGEEKCTHLS
jgi:hypothetical protein